MFKLLLLVVALFSICLADDYCDGWRAGYIAGYNYGSTYGVPPVVPVCPVPNGNDSFQGGYNDGFLAGINTKK